MPLEIQTGRLILLAKLEFRANLLDGFFTYNDIRLMFVVLGKERQPQRSNGWEKLEEDKNGWKKEQEGAASVSVKLARPTQSDNMAGTVCQQTTAACSAEGQIMNAIVQHGVLCPY
ncbi:unnamed protein product [Leuciscus chuanchicus]